MNEISTPTKPKKIFLCDGCGDGHGISINVYPDLVKDQVFLEYWHNFDEVGLSYWERIKKAFHLIKDGAFCWHDIILTPDTCDALAEEIKAAAEIARNCEPDVAEALLKAEREEFLEWKKTKEGKSYD